VFFTLFVGGGIFQIFGRFVKLLFSWGGGGGPLQKGRNKFKRKHNAQNKGKQKKELNQF